MLKLMVYPVFHRKQLKSVKIKIIIMGCKLSCIYEDCLLGNVIHVNGDILYNLLFILLALKI